MYYCFLGQVKQVWISFFFFFMWLKKVHFKKEKKKKNCHSFLHESLEHIPACLQARGGVHLGQVSSSSKDQQKKNKQPFALTFTPKVNLNQPLYLSTVFGLWEEVIVPSENPQAKGCKLHTKQAAGLQGIQTFFCDSANLCTNVCYLIFVNLRQSRLSNSLPLKL